MEKAGAVAFGDIRRGGRRRRYEGGRVNHVLPDLRNSAPSPEGWHRATTPKMRTSFREDEFGANVGRDDRNLRDVDQLGWSVMIVWGVRDRGS